MMINGNMFMSKTNFYIKFLEISNLLSIKKIIAKKRGIIIPLPVLYMRSIILGLEKFPESYGLNFLFFRNIPYLKLNIDGKGLIENPFTMDIFSLYEWYEDTNFYHSALSLSDKLNFFINPEKIADKIGTVSIIFPGKYGVDICSVNKLTSLTFSIGSIQPLWNEYDEEKDKRKWGSCINLICTKKITYKLAGEILNTISKFILEPDFPEIENLGDIT